MKTYEVITGDGKERTVTAEKYVVGQVLGGTAFNDLIFKDGSDQEGCRFAQGYWRAVFEINPQGVPSNAE